MKQQILILANKAKFAVKLTKFKTLSIIVQQIFLLRSKIYFRSQFNKKENSRAKPALTIYLINLLHRKDRLQTALANHRDIGMNNVRIFKGIQNDNGALGCALSHVSVLTEFLASQSGDLVVVIEDDCRFEIDFMSIFELIEEFHGEPKLKVLVLAPSVQSSPIKISSNLSVCANIQTTACYVVKREFVAILLRSFQESARQLAKGFDRHEVAIDIRWKNLQKKHFFAIPNRPIAFQEPSYSDIEERNVDYNPKSEN